MPTKMRELMLKLVIVSVSVYGSTSGLSIGKSGELDVKKVVGVDVSAPKLVTHEQDEVETATEFKDRPKDGDTSGEITNLQALQEGRGKKKKKIKGVLFLMMVAMAVKCITVLKALTIKALLASKIALVLSLLSIMKKLFEKPEHKPQTNIVLKREPEHHYSRSDMIARIDDSWIDDHEDRTANRRRSPLAKGVFDGWSGRYQRPRGVFLEVGEEGRKAKRNKERPCDCTKGYLLGSLERGKGDWEHQGSKHQNDITGYEFSDSKKSNKPVLYSAGNSYPYARNVGKNKFVGNSGTRDRNLLNGEEQSSRESNINKGMINHYNNEVFKGSDWAGINLPKSHATNNGFEDGRSTQVFANWDAYKKFSGNRRSIEDDRQRPSVNDGSEIRDRQQVYYHRPLGASSF